MRFDKTTNLRRLGIVTAALIVMGAAAGCSSSGSSGASAAGAGGSCGASASKMTLHGSGQAQATPDLLTVVVSVDVTGATAKAALADNNARTTKLHQTFTFGGVAAKDVQTSGLTIEPQYAYPAGKPPRLTGYHVTDTVTAKLRNLDKAGVLIDAVADAAGDAIRISSLTFSMEDPSGLHDLARANAVRSVVGQATATAKAAGQRLGRICSIRDDQVNTMSNGQFDALRAAPSSGAASAVPLAPGSVEADSNVTVVYALAG
ncbi:MAG TPA: SIMPL domain-containing protein [Acidimicrobiales bacterium]|jgi:uncharacterized protein YggE|nr:SIMPL domain-containing protein [Acidimicrobiales bacterium]